MNSYKTAGITVLLCSTFFTASAQVPTETISAFREKMHIEDVAIVTPTVVEVPLNSLIEERNFLIVEDATQKIIPWFLHEQYKIKPIPFTGTVAINSLYQLTPGVLFDSNVETGLAFNLPEDKRGVTEITINPQTPVLSSAITFDFGRNVVLPSTIEIRAIVDGKISIVLAEVPFTDARVQFIPTYSPILMVTLKYAQPMVINEITLTQDNVERSVTRGLRYLAQPNVAYTIYHSPDRTTSIPFVEQGNLRNDTDILFLGPVLSVENSFFSPADSDKDGVLDSEDNCISVMNKDQLDLNQNAQGDACDDFDRDNHMNSVDNCVNIPNAGQEDEDGDSIGDVCDFEESRLTEKYTWVPWVGMGIALLVLCALFILVGMAPKNTPQD